MKKIICSITVISMIFSASHLYFNKHKRTVLIVNNSIFETPTIVIDAGHGGQDSGTIAKDGTFESDINLAISCKLKIHLESYGFNVIMTRTGTDLIGDNSLPTIRERKRSDVNKRLKIIESTKNSILISVHQNYFNDAKYYGVQVFYSKNHENSKIIAQSIQESTVTHVQRENKRAIKASGKEIWLLHNTKSPAVMVECGFLSNPNELSNLKNEQYQMNIAFMIAIGVLNYYTK